MQADTAIVRTEKILNLRFISVDFDKSVQIVRDLVPMRKTITKGHTNFTKICARGY